MDHENNLKSKTFVKKLDVNEELYRSNKRERTKSGGRNKTSIGYKNTTLSQCLIRNKERKGKQKQAETTELITKRRKRNTLKTEEDKLEYLGKY